MDFFDPGTYTIVVGTGGAGAVTFNAGSAGTASSFDSLTIGGGGGGGGSASASVVQGGLAPAGTTSQWVLLRENGYPPGEVQGGNGGSGYFGEGGKASMNTTGNVDGGAGGLYGGGGGGACNNGTGGAGANGAVIVIEHF